MHIAGGLLVLLWVLCPTRYDLAILLVLALVCLNGITDSKQK